MTDHDLREAGEIDVDAIRRDLARLPALPWELWTACSFRRITGPDGKDGGVLHAYNQRSDNHPDLSMPEEQLFALVRLINAYPALLSRLSTAEAERDEALDAIRAIQLRAFSDGTRTFDDCMNALGWIDNHARAALTRLKGEAE